MLFLFFNVTKRNATRGTESRIIADLSGEIRNFLLKAVAVYSAKLYAINVSPTSEIMRVDGMFSLG